MNGLWIASGHSVYFQFSDIGISDIENWMVAFLSVLTLEANYVE